MNIESITRDFLPPVVTGALAGAATGDFVVGPLAAGSVIITNFATSIISDSAYDYLPTKKAYREIADLGIEVSLMAATSTASAVITAYTNDSSSMKDIALTSSIIFLCHFGTKLSILTIEKLIN